VASLNSNVCELIESRTPTTSEQAAQLADLYYETQGRKEVDISVLSRSPVNNLRNIMKDDINYVNAKDKTGDMSSQSNLKCWTCGGEHKQKFVLNAVTKRQITMQAY